MLYMGYNPTLNGESIVQVDDVPIKSLPMVHNTMINQKGDGLPVRKLLLSLESKTYL